MKASYLHTDLWQVDLHGQLLTAVYVRVVGFLECSLQLMELVRGEGGAVPSVLLLGIVFLGRLWRLTVAVHLSLQVTHFSLTLVTGEKARLWWEKVKRVPFKLDNYHICCYCVENKLTASVAKEANIKDIGKRHNESRNLC